MPKKLRLAVNTGGGDAPGLNAVLRAVTLTALNRGYEVVGIRKGYLGLLDTSQLVPLTFETVRGITHLGGSILGTNNRGNPLAIRVVENGRERFVDVSDQAVQNFHRLGFDGLIAVGGDGSLKIAAGLARKGIPIIGVPKTIDNDLAATAMTFGFDTAVATATEAIDKLHSTAESHDRVMVVEVMGRHCGWIALSAGIAGSADVILLPEIPFRMEKVCEKIMAREAAGRHFSIVVCAEGAVPVGGDLSVVEEARDGKELRLGGIAGSADVILLPEIPFRMEKVCEKIMAREAAGRHFSIVVCAEGAVPVGGDLTILEEAREGKELRLGGIAEKVAHDVQALTGKEARSIVLGHLQRGGQPTPFDRLLSLRFGAAAVRLAETGQWGTMVAYGSPEMTAVPLEQAVATVKRVPVDGETVRTARELGISLGD